MVVSSVSAMVIGIGVHGFSAYNAILSAISGFNAGMIETLANTPSAMLLSLLNRGGVNSMSTTLIIIVAAFLLAAGMDVSGALDKLLQTMIERAKSVFGLIAATLASGATMIALTSHGGVTALIVGGLFQDGYPRTRPSPREPVALARRLGDDSRTADALDRISYLHGNNPGRAHSGVHALGGVLYDWLDFFVIAGSLL